MTLLDKINMLILYLGGVGISLMLLHAIIKFLKVRSDKGSISQSRAQRLTFCSVRSRVSRNRLRDSTPEIIAPHDEVGEVLEIVYDEMVNYKTVKKDFGIQFNLPLKIDAEVGTSFGDGKEVEFINGRPVL